MSKTSLPPLTHNLVPFKELVSWPDNPRPAAPQDKIDTMAASILDKQQVLQNLLCRPYGAHIQVIAGRTRHFAIEKLVTDGKLKDDFLVPCAIGELTDAQATDLALTENVIRDPMNPMEEFESFARLIENGYTIDHIAEAYGISKKTVERRLAFARLIPEVKDLVRAGARDLGWAAAMTMASPEFQNRVAAEIATQPDSWRTGYDVQRFLTANSIPMVHTIFDKDLYKGPLLKDLFSDELSTYFADVDEFWRLQNQAIDTKVDSYHQAGWHDVKIVRDGPVELWRYQRTDIPADGMVIIEVHPNGQVVVHEGLYDPDRQLPAGATAPDGGVVVADETETEGAADQEPELFTPSSAANTDGSTGNTASNVQPFEAADRGPTPAMLEYASCYRSAAVQIAVATDTKLAKRLLILGLIGHPEMSVRSQTYAFAGSAHVRTGVAFDKLRDMHDRYQAKMIEIGAGTIEASRTALLAALEKMADKDLDKILAWLTATRIGQFKPRALDTSDNSLLNQIAKLAGVDIRAYWTPDEQFFSRMDAAAMRELISSKLPPEYHKGIMSAKRADLAKILTDAFAQAAEKAGAFSAEVEHELNTWLPSFMAYPAKSNDTPASAAPDDADALFQAEPEDAAAAA